MHEMSLARNILDIVDEYMDTENGRVLKKVVVEVGELTAVLPQSLEFCYQALVENSRYHGSKILIKIVPLSGVCLDCHHSFKIIKFEFKCPLCQSSHIDVKGGQELRISHLEVD